MNSRFKVWELLLIMFFSCFCTGGITYIINAVEVTKLRTELNTYIEKTDNSIEQLNDNAKIDTLFTDCYYFCTGSGCTKCYNSIYIKDVVQQIIDYLDLELKYTPQSIKPESIKLEKKAAVNN